MSKYYKAEDVINAIEDKIAEYIPTLYGRYAEIPLELRMAIEHLPTIEVSEDCISREYLEEEYWQALIPKEMINTDVDLGINIGVDKMHDVIKNAPSVIPQVPSEDAISREWVLSQGKYYYNGKGGQEYAIPIGTIKNAPSVVPSIIEDRDTQVLDNWQVYHRNMTSAVEGEWITEKGSYEIICSKCKYGAFDAGGVWFLSDYCPNCGAKMKG